MAKRFIDVDKSIAEIDKGELLVGNNAEWAKEILLRMPADVVEVEKVSEQIIRRKAEIIDYWKNNVKQYRAMQGYCDIEHDVDNFLRGYNEAVEDMLAILDGVRKDGDEVDL